MPISSITVGQGLVAQEADGTPTLTLTSTGTISVDPEVSLLIDDVAAEMDTIAVILSSYSGGLFGGHW